MARKWSFEVVPDVFRDLSELQTHPSDKISTQPSLALLTRPYPSDGQSDGQSDGGLELEDWARLARYVRYLNDESPRNISYKVLYLTRHGVGFHNKKHVEVGNDEWNSNWSLKDGDGVTTWFDSFLADEGVQQASDLSSFWTDLVARHKAPLPQSHYCSPLARCLQTASLVFGPLMAASGKPLGPVTVKEALRERWTMHTCDKRRTRTWIVENWGDKGFVMEDGFPEEDQLCRLDREETDEEHVARKQGALEDIFESDTNEFLSLTVHSYAIRAILAVCRARDFRVREGSSIALLVKGERLSAGGVLS